jgi:hypothetical protein
MKTGLFSALIAALLILSSLEAVAEADIKVRSWMWYRGNWGYYQAVGEVENIGDSNAEFVMLTATWYSDAGSVVATDFTFSMLDIIQPGEKSPFRIILLGDDIHPERAKLQLSWNETSIRPDRDVRVRDTSASYDPVTQCLELIGEVENLGLRAADFVMVIITGYNEEDEVVAADFTFSTLDKVASNSTSPFKTYVCDRANQIVRYSYIVQHGY